ncbi:MAG TPA: IS982 family transposase [Clostridiales bacterium]|nr:IS982 family transposase [Clostridiales bacterium]
MIKQIQLIKTYCAICQYYDSTICKEAQRLSNNFSPKFTDAECMTIYIFGIQEGYRTVKAMYCYIKSYWHDWFPDLPSYVAFNTRICNLAQAFASLAGILMLENDLSASDMNFLMDSMPVIVANSKRSNSAKAASEMCDKGYCSSKNMYYYGVKIHLLAQRQPGTLPIPHDIVVSRASENDLAVAKEYLEPWHNITVFADKAYRDSSWNLELAERGVEVITPVKLKKGQKTLSYFDKLFSSAVSSARQTIEVFFSWLADKTGINSASKVRSSNGLIAFIFARLVAALYS